MTEMTEVAIDKLSAEDRLTLIAALWDSLTDDEATVSEAQRAELARRLAAFSEDRGEALAWDDLKAELRARKP